MIAEEDYEKWNDIDYDKVVNKLERNSMDDEGEALIIGDVTIYRACKFDDNSEEYMLTTGERCIGIWNENEVVTKIIERNEKNRWGCIYIEIKNKEIFKEENKEERYLFSCDESKLSEDVKNQIKFAIKNNEIVSIHKISNYGIRTERCYYVQHDGMLKEEKVYICNVADILEILKSDYELVKNNKDITKIFKKILLLRCYISHDDICTLILQYLFYDKLKIEV
jgi:hypothetical protein